MKNLLLRIFFSKSEKIKSQRMEIVNLKAELQLKRDESILLRRQNEILRKNLGMTDNNNFQRELLKSQLDNFVCSLCNNTGIIYKGKLKEPEKCKACEALRN